MMLARKVTATIAAVVLAAAAAWVAQGQAALAGGDGGGWAVGVREGGSLDSFVVEGRGVSEKMDSLLLQDLETLAKQTGADLDELKRSHEDIDDFSELATAFEEKYPDIYVRSGVDGEGEARNWLLFTELPPAEVVDRLHSLSVDVEIIYGAPAPAVEIAAVEAALISAAADSKEAFEGAEARYDATRSVIELEYVANPDAASSIIDDAVLLALRAAAHASNDGLLPAPVEPIESASTQGAVQETVVSGGRTLRRVSNNAEWCTAGFTAERNGNRGLITARHCDVALKYQQEEDVIDPDGVGATASVWLDLSWHRTLGSHSTNKQFRATGTQSSDDRVVENVSNSPQGHAVCHWGITTGYACSSVQAQDVCVTLSGIDTCGLDKTYLDVSSPGDSGGPWFTANTARGIHAGAAQGDASYFTRIGRIPSGLDATVLED